MAIDRKWFQEKIQKDYGSQRRFAVLLKGRDGEPMDHASLSRMLSGDREMLLSEAVQIAQLLGVSLNEITRRMGLTR